MLFSKRIISVNFLLIRVGKRGAYLVKFLQKHFYEKIIVICLEDIKKCFNNNCSPALCFQAMDI